jgi:carbamoyltransferase
VIVLGISGGLGHDATAALVRDGEVVAVAEEERFVRRRHAYGLAPVSAVMYCVHEAGITLSDVDCLALSWDPSIRHPRWPTDLHEKLLAHPFFNRHKKPEIQVVEHSRAHAAASYFCSGFDSAAVLTVDGQGDGVSTTIGRGKGGALETYRSFGIPESLGFYYLALTNYLGFELGEEGKVMGLASYAEPTHLSTPFELTDDGVRVRRNLAAAASSYALYRDVVASWTGWFESTFGPVNQPRYELDPSTGRARAAVDIGDHQRRVAATGQAELERVLLHLVKLAVEESGSRQLVIGGGVGLNCSANGVIQRSGLVDELYVFPASGDAGTSLGAALEVSAQAGCRPSEAIETASWGPSFSDQNIAATVRRFGVRAKQSDDIAADAARLLEQGKVIGWFQGRMEVGPRALGNRSILVDPTDASSHARVNTIKGREQWRPLAPSLLADAADEYMDSPGRAPFMLTACPVKDEVRERVPSVVHVDGTCRPQLVRPETNQRYADLLAAWVQRSGVPVVLNTSYNLAGEPIVCSPQDAIRTFFASGLDALVLGRTIISK